MNPEEKEIEGLFAYGTLQQEAVQRATFGRKLEGKPDVLRGYRMTMIQTQDQNFAATSGSAQQRSLQFTGVASDLVAGTVFQVTKKELEQADAYEPEDYERVLVRLKSGINAWVYYRNQDLPDHIRAPK